MTKQTFVAWLRRPGRSVAIAVLAGVVMLVPATARADDEVLVSIGTGELSGVYYSVGKAICQIVNQDFRTHAIRCSPETTPGSVYNIDALGSGELDFAIVQSDVQYAAYHGEGTWHGRPFRELRSVVSLYPELVTIIARADSSIHDLGGLAGRRLNVGGRDSGTRATWDAIQTELGWRDEKRVHPVELRMDATTSALCSGAIDANLLIVGHPSPLVRTQTAGCAVDFVAVAGPAIDKLVRDHPYYQHGAIGATYGLATEVPTFGVRATLVTSVSVDTRVVAVITRELLTHLAELRAVLPALAGLRSGEMIKDGLTAPLHPGAALAIGELEQHE